ncbi:alginate export family protein [Flavobacterium sp. 245]|uniref:alginate export family protein n=1 Tax=Flavobacterium sp. 245 TaxID=2512115 RepID=UPI00105D31BC|nr:alginate export family protein [Flavobacterium sp. 245]TDO95589.1 alginate export protein [Flavobacterium sp. 245]
MKINAIIKICHIVFIALLYSHKSNAQETEKLSEQFLVNFEIRPRAEYTSNYIIPPNNTVDPYFYISQRNRISAQYERQKWLIKSDFQEIHLWDQKYDASKVGSINFYQLFLETKFKSLNVRIGRQSILLDNGRLFSDAPWAQQGRAHEGIRIMKQTEKLSDDFFALFTRNYNTEFESAYSPVAANKYKYLLINYFRYKFNSTLSFNSITAMDFLKNTYTENLYARATAGARIEFNKRNWSYTLNTYTQFGKNINGKNLSAYYFQPEIKFSTKKSILRLGAEIISGSSPRLSTNTTGDFDVLYGVTWKFNGNMNVFTRFPADVSGKGLVNPYLFATVSLNSKLSLRSDFHLFYSQYPLLNNTGQELTKYLGFENDISVKYQPIKQLEINCAFSFYKSSGTMKYLPKIQDETKLAYWSYLMLSYSFNVVNSKKTKNLKS